MYLEGTRHMTFSSIRECWGCALPSPSWWWCGAKLRRPGGELMWNNHISNSFQCSWGMSLVVFHSKMPISVQSQKTVGRKIFTQAPSVALWQLSGMCHCLKWSIVGKILWSQFFLKNLKKYSPNLNHIFQFDFVTEVKYFVTHYLCANRWTYKKVRILNDICFGLWALSFEQLEKILFQKSEEHAYDP